MITIIGCERECECDHCGRPLKVGIRTDLLGTIGADCFRAMMPVDRRRFSQGRPDAGWLRTLAKLRERDSDESLRRMGYGPHHFVFATI